VRCDSARPDQTTNTSTRSCFRQDRALLSSRRAVTFLRTRWGVSDPRRSGPGTDSGGWQRGSLTPHITLISHPRGFGGGEERRLDHQQRASRSPRCSMTCQATPPLELFAACSCMGASRSIDRGNTAPASVFPLPRRC
jgi:hypothetical protein